MTPKDALPLRPEPLDDHLAFTRARVGLKGAWALAVAAASVLGLAHLLPETVTGLILLGLGIAALLLLASPPRITITPAGIDYRSIRTRRHWSWAGITELKLRRTAMGFPVITFRSPDGDAFLKGPWGVDPQTVFTAINLAHVRWG